MAGVGEAGESGVSFSSDSSRLVLEKACDLAQMDSDGAELLRLGENAIYRLVNDPVVVRIARTIDHLYDAAKEVSVSRWLSGRGFPVANLIEMPPPVVVDGHRKNRSGTGRKKWEPEWNREEKIVDV